MNGRGSRIRQRMMSVCMPAWRSLCQPSGSLGAQPALQRDVVLGGNGRALVSLLCSVMDWRLLCKHALGYHCLAQPLARGHPANGVTSAGKLKQTLKD